MDDHLFLSTNPPVSRPQRGMVSLYFDPETNSIRAWDSNLNEVFFGTSSSGALTPPEGQSFLLTGTEDGQIPGPFDDDADALANGVPHGYPYQNGGQVFVVSES